MHAEYNNVCYINDITHLLKIVIIILGNHQWDHVSWTDQLSGQRRSSPKNLNATWGMRDVWKEYLMSVNVTVNLSLDIREQISTIDVCTYQGIWTHHNDSWKVSNFWGQRIQGQHSCREAESDKKEHKYLQIQLRWYADAAFSRLQLGCNKQVPSPFSWAFLIEMTHEIINGSLSIMRLPYLTYSKIHVGIVLYFGLSIRPHHLLSSTAYKQPWSAWYVLAAARLSCTMMRRRI